MENFTSNFTKFEHPLVPVVAPFGLQITNKESGYIYNRITRDRSTLNKIATLIGDSNPGLSGFEPLLALIVTFIRFHVTPQILVRQIIHVCVWGGGGGTEGRTRARVNQLRYSQLTSIVM